MKPSAIFRGIAAGLFTVICWHAAIAASWMYAGTLPIILCGVAAGVLIILLLHQRGNSLGFLLSVVTGVLTGGLTTLITTELELEQLLLQIVFAGHWRRAIGGAFAITVTSLIFYAVVLLAVLLAYALRPRGKEKSASAPQGTSTSSQSSRFFYPEDEE